MDSSFDTGRLGKRIIGGQRPSISFYAFLPALSGLRPVAHPLMVPADRQQVDPDHGLQQALGFRPAPIARPDGEQAEDNEIERADIAHGLAKQEIDRHANDRAFERADTSENDGEEDDRPCRLP